MKKMGCLFGETVLFSSSVKEEGRSRSSIISFRISSKNSQTSGLLPRKLMWSQEGKMAKIHVLTVVEADVEA
jgi:hypothetical protein